MNNTFVNCELKQFDWNAILSAYSNFEQNRFNPNLFEYKNTATIFAKNEEIHIHPGDENTLNTILPMLASAVTSFFGIEATVTAESGGTISVFFKRFVSGAKL